MKKADVGVALYLLAAVVFFIVPIPNQLLDVMLALNISIALVVLFNCLFVQEVLDMSFFPTLLLFTTIFRIALNVSSTRLILTTGDPGNVVATFGAFVGGNDIIVGAIIFIVLVIIQFVVINKGSERVSEVTARFTLDAMPGKQMAIDADLNTGAIDDREARVRREKIQAESAFFGSMDGATKYVKGDAGAGLLITGINLVGGTVMGMTREGLEAVEALQKYGILTIGDGLASQMPSLMISLATGILVTKASKEADFSDVLVSQLFGIPKVLYLVGLTLAFLGITTPLNAGLFIAFGLVYVITGRANDPGGRRSRRNPKARECCLPAAGRPDRAGIWLRHYSVSGCQPGRRPFGPRGHDSKADCAGAWNGRSDYPPARQYPAEPEPVYY